MFAITRFSLYLTCEQALLFGRVKRVSRERASERRSREGQRKGAPRSRVLARLASLAQIGELASRLRYIEVLFLKKFYYYWGKENRSFYRGLRYKEVRYIKVLSNVSGYEDRIQCFIYTLLLIQVLSSNFYIFRIFVRYDTILFLRWSLRLA